METPQVQQAIVYHRGLNRTSGEDALHANRLRGCRETKLFFFNTRGSRRANGESGSVLERRCLKSDAEKFLSQVLHGVAWQRVQTIPRVALRRDAGSVARAPAVPASPVQRVFGCVQGGLLQEIGQPTLNGNAPLPSPRSSCRSLASS